MNYFRFQFHFFLFAVFFSLFLCSCIGNVTPLFKQSSFVTSQSSSVLGLQSAEEKIFRNGNEYHGIGVNYFNAFYRTVDSDGSDKSYKPGLALLNQYGIPFIRFNLVGFYKKGWTFAFENQQKYLSLLDKFLDECEKNKIGVIPSFFWNFEALPDYVNENPHEWGNANSKTYQAMLEFTEMIVKRYQNHSAIWAWEMGNELASAGVLPIQLRRTANELSWDEAAVAYQGFLSVVKKYDSHHRFISTGSSVAHPSSYHLSQNYSFNVDSISQHADFISRAYPDGTLLSVHLYPWLEAGWGGVSWFGNNHLVGDILASYMQVAKLTKKALFLGEFGASWTSNYQGDFVKEKKKFFEFMNAIVQQKVPLSAVWVYDFNHFDPIWNITPSNPRAYQLEAIRDANLQLGASTLSLEQRNSNVKMVERSLLNVGNQARLQRLFNKANTGVPFTIATIGGSITQGIGATISENRYASLVQKWWDQKFWRSVNYVVEGGNYPASGVTLANAGIAATGSDYGTLRLQRDVLSKNPDLVIIEFAVNDWSLSTNGDYYEGLIRQVLAAPNSPAVILVFMLNKGLTSQQSWQASLGAYYDLPMISYGDAIKPEIQSGRMSWSQFSNDDVHPNDFGHSLVAQSISYYLESSLKNFVLGSSPDVIQSIPVALRTNAFQYPTLVEAPQLTPTSNTGWTLDDTHNVNAAWVASTIGSSIEFSITGTHIGFSFWKVSGGKGIVNVSIDGGAPVLVNSSGGRSFKDIAKNLTPGAHRVRFELRADDTVTSTDTLFRIVWLGSGNAQ